MQILTTPTHHFDNLPGFPYQPNFVEINGAKVHYIDEGKGEVILCLHGEPTWSYLYRKFIPIFSPHYRVIAMDFIGFGKSDKYADMKDYSYKMHLNTLLGFIEKLQLNNITVVVQDWGGLLGLGAVGAIPEKFARLVILNTFLPIGDRPMPFPIKVWRAFAKYFPGLPVGFVMKMGMYQPKLIPKEVIRAYEAPFPSNKFKAGAKAFPLLVPMNPDYEGVAEMKRAREVLKQWNKPALVMFSDKDPIMRGADRYFRKWIPTANEQPITVIRDAGHFLQEEKGEEIAEHIHAFIQRTPLAASPSE